MFFEPSGFSNAVSDGVQNNPTSLEKETFDIRDLRPISKDPESSGPIVLLVGTDTGEDEEYYGDYSTEGLILPRYAEATEYLMKGDVYLQNDANYEDYRDYLFATDYGGDDDNGLMEGDRSNEGLLINNILVDDTKWAWKTPGLSDDEDVDISIHGNKYVLQHPSLIKSYYTVFLYRIIDPSSRDILAEDLPVSEATLVPITESPIIWGKFQASDPFIWGKFQASN